MKLFIRAPASSAPMERVISHGGLLVLNLTEPGYLTRCWNHLFSDSATRRTDKLHTHTRLTALFPGLPG